MEPCTEAVASTEVGCTAVVGSIAAASIVVASIAAVSIVGPESDMALCVGTPPIHPVPVVTMAVSIAAVSIAAVSRTGAVGCTAAASIAVVHTECIEEAAGDKDGLMLATAAALAAAAVRLEGAGVRRESWSKSSHRST